VLWVRWDLLVSKADQVGLDPRVQMERLESRDHVDRPEDPGLLEIPASPETWEVQVSRCESYVYCIPALFAYEYRPTHGTDMPFVPVVCHATLVETS